MQAGGRRHIGYKIGLTSEAARASLGAREPGRGYLFADDVHASPHTFSPRAFPVQFEVELAVRIRDTVSPGMTSDDILRAVDVAAALEIVASRWRPPATSVGAWAADNAMAEAAVVGEFFPGVDRWREPLIVTLGDGSTHVGSAQTAIDALRWLAAERQSFGAPLTAGTMILTGALVGPLSVAAGDSVSATIAGIGDVAASFA
jgi:2-keto-4-pentenoate hydratase